MQDFVCFSSLQRKEVINCDTGERLGYICDAEIDTECGVIKYFIVPIPHPSFTLKPCERRRFQFCDIKTIGEDFILITKSYPCPVRKKVL